MMNNWIIVAVFAGIASAAMVASIVVQSPLAAPLLLLAPLPLFIVGFGWGPVAAAIAGLAATLMLSIGISVAFGASFLVSMASAPVVLSHLSLINRPAGEGSASEGEPGDEDLEWYPEGRLIAWAAVISFAILMLMVFVAGEGPDALEANFEATMIRALDELKDTGNAEQVARMKSFVAIVKSTILPIGAVSLLLLSLFHMSVASRLLKSSGRALRPWAPFASYTLPKSAGIALAASITALFLPGVLGTVALVAFALIFTVFSVIGFATLIGLTKGNPMQGFILATVCVALFVLTWVAMLPLTVLALVDQHLGLRARRNRAAGALNE